MSGRVRTQEKCPICSGKFEPIPHPVTGDVFDLMCIAHKTRPRRVYIDGRSFRNRKGSVGYLFRDENYRLFGDYSHAKRMLESIRHDYDKDPRKFDPTKWSTSARKVHTVKALAEEWQGIVEKTCSKGYAGHVEMFFRLHINPVLGGIDVRELTPDDIENFHLSLMEKMVKDRAGREGKMAPKSIQGVMTTLKMLLKRAKGKKRLIDVVPDFPKLKVPKKIRGWIGWDVQSEILRHVPAHRLGTDPLETLFRTGIRINEGIALCARSVVDDGVYVDAALSDVGDLKETKNGYEAHFPLPPDLYARLKKLAKGKSPEAILFIRPCGRPWTTSSLSDLWGDACKKAGVRIPLNVAVRHSKVSKFYMDQRKALEESARQQLHHGDFKMTKIHYLQPGRAEIHGSGVGIEENSGK